MLNDKYQIIDIINNGNYGKVYKVLYNNKLYALKEELNNNNIILLNEANIYKELRFIKNIGKMKDYFVYNNKNYLLLNLYDKNLIEFKNENFNNNNYQSRINNIFDTLLNTIKNIHNYGYLHRDIKPGNICLDENSIPILIDFGFSKKYIINKKHNEEKNIQSIIGSYDFISKNIYKLIEPSRRDDIESLLYVYIYMLILDKYEKHIHIFKNSTNAYIKNILVLSNISIDKINNIINLLNYIQLLRYNSEPNYCYIKNLLIN